MSAPRAPANRAEVVEVMAHAALWQPWAKFGLDEQDRLHFIAHTTLAALEAAGVRLVPVEATEEMRRVVAVNWGRRTWQEFADVVAASPYAPEGGA